MFDPGRGTVRDICTSCGAEFTDYPGEQCERHEWHDKPPCKHENTGEEPEPGFSGPNQVFRVCYDCNEVLERL